MYETTEEKKRNVLLYGVPGIPSLLLPHGSTFYDVRRILWVRAPHLYKRVTYLPPDLPQKGSLIFLKLGTLKVHDR